MAKQGHESAARSRKTGTQRAAFDKRNKPERPTSETWRFAVGRLGVNRVTVYERKLGASIYIEWYDDDGRHQKALKNLTGSPVTDRRLAVRIAERVADEQEKKRNALAQRVVFGEGSIQHTVGELLARWEADKKDEWVPMYLKHQQRYRKFWADKLGADRLLNTVSEAEVELVAREHAKGKGWAPRSHVGVLRYLQDAFAYGQRLRWLKDDEMLRLKMPKVRAQERGRYTVLQAKALLEELERRDLRAAFVAYAYAQAGRRLSASRKVKTGDVQIVKLPRGLGEAVEVMYRAETDKTKAPGKAILVGPAVRVVKALLATKAVRSSHHLCPAGPLDKKPTLRSLYRPVAPSTLNDILRAAEEAIGIEHKERRGYHAFKRLFADLGRATLVAAHQSGTSQVTLSRIYAHDAPVEARAALALSVVEQIESAEAPQD